MHLREACLEIMEDRVVRDKYPEGLMAKDILHEIRVKHGEDAFVYCSILDVCDEMKALYG